MPASGDTLVGTDVSTIVSVQLGTVAYTSQTSNGTVTSGTTETRDAVLGNLTFVVAAAQNTTRFKVTLSGRGLFSTVAGDRFAINIRDGGGSTPSATSTLVGVNFTQVMPSATGSNGIQASTFSTTFVAGTGTHTLSVFTVRVNGTGTATPSGACEFYAEAIGTV